MGGFIKTLDQLSERREGLVEIGQAVPQLGAFTIAVLAGFDELLGFAESAASIRTTLFFRSGIQELVCHV